ncbi:MAG: zf-HC2 domain-containing protein [Candidatus Rokubacteria bacterium]|nr:zf-HC2 domain-containing protein [Candidatus Rokubacteria bacterium]
MTCQDAIAILADYLEAACGPELSAKLEAHFADCEPCRAYLATYKKTRDLAAAANRVEMPEEMKRRLRALLLEQLRQGG